MLTNQAYNKLYEDYIKLIDYLERNKPNVLKEFYEAEQQVEHTMRRSL